MGCAGTRLGSPGSGHGSCLLWACSSGDSLGRKSNGAPQSPLGPSLVPVYPVNRVNVLLDLLLKQGGELSDDAILMTLRKCVVQGPKKSEEDKQWQ